MKRKHISGLLLVTLGILSFSLFGCQSTTKAPDKKETTTESPQATPEEDDGLRNTDEERPGLDAEVPQTPLDEIQGEGTTDDTAPDLTDIKVAPLNSPVAFTSESGADLCALTINSIQVTEVQGKEDNTAEKVVLVDYSFENISAKEPLLFDSMSFKLLEDKTVAKPYFFPELKNAELAEEGKTGSGQIAFTVSKDCKDVTLVFDNADVDEKIAFQATLEK